MSGGREGAARHGRGALVSAAVAVIVCAFVVVWVLADTGESAAPEAGTTLREVVEHGERHLGRVVEISGEVEDGLDSGPDNGFAFLLGDDAGLRLLVVPARANDAVREPDPHRVIRVRGRVVRVPAPGEPRPHGLSALPRELLAVRRSAGRRRLHHRRGGAVRARAVTPPRPISANVTHVGCADGAARAELSNALVAIARRDHGRGPTAARVVVADDVAICRMENPFTPQERALIGIGRFADVQAARAALRERLREELRSTVEAHLGRPVIADVAGWYADPDLAVEVFVLQRGTDR